ncbi:hypothetical protein K3495_g4978 [Podosphaera aphanis]|nr:hypothetical protein K3495_g4978 [Podosphaera aphanis]
MDSERGELYAVDMNNRDPDIWPLDSRGVRRRPASHTVLPERADVVKMPGSSADPSPWAWGI